jgi:hypothetical protein
LFDRPISGASMNPARSLGPAMVSHEYRGIWIYVVSPILGAQAGAWVYNLIRYTDKPLREITKSASFLQSKGRFWDEMVVEGDDSIPFFYIGASDQGMHASQHLKKKGFCFVNCFFSFLFCVYFLFFFAYRVLGFFWRFFFFFGLWMDAVTQAKKNQSSHSHEPSLKKSTSSYFYFFREYGLLLKK